MFLSIGFFAIFWVFGNLDYSTVFSLSPNINEVALTVIGLLLLLAAMGKSAQLGLHTWLPDAMEGLSTLLFRFISLYLVLDQTRYLSLGSYFLPFTEYDNCLEDISVATNEIIGYH